MTLPSALHGIRRGHGRLGFSYSALPVRWIVPSGHLQVLQNAPELSCVESRVVIGMSQCGDLVEYASTVALRAT